MPASVSCAQGVASIYSPNKRHAPGLRLRVRLTDDLEIALATGRAEIQRLIRQWRLVAKWARGVSLLNDHAVRPLAVAVLQQTVFDLQGASPAYCGIAEPFMAWAGRF
jgi:hypothetical protein